MKINKNLYKLDTEDSFFTATKKINAYKMAHPTSNVVSLGIGDVSFPVIKIIADQMKKAADRETTDDFIGYGAHYGIFELRKAIKENEYPMFTEDEIYVSDGTKTDAGDILEMLDKNALVGIFTPTYPIYVNSIYSLNRDYELIDCDENYDLVVPDKHFDALYICSPNNPTGINYSYSSLKAIVDYAIKENCIIIYDNVYFRFITSGVKSIYEVPGAKNCAIELRSFSKHVSFTGVRCSYYVVPNELHENINKIWKCRTINRFNGASYIAQIGALASFDSEAQKEIEEHMHYYKRNSEYLIDNFKKLGYEVFGGVNAPYIWVKCKNNLSSWETFDLFLNKIEVIIVPGIIFGERGKNYFRVSALGKFENICEAVERVKNYEKI